eukprot:TRINITY_DN1805_c0_g1_i1.p1 TRINITY_DN1805_c0_g1~~TRINITY_DN1805_c0_g1_i1.p1  ORF type:complete len:325 (+),score=92.31 TRINITY_DN1805_c0_g1_i1:281-1255(+)
MARNEEKNRAALNRLVNAKSEKEQVDKFYIPPLFKLTNAREVKRYIPKIRREIQYCLRMISGKKRFRDSKLEEFKERLDDLKGKYRSFVKKAIQYDPSLAVTPGKKHAYISKTQAEEMAEKRRKMKQDNPNGYRMLYGEEPIPYVIPPQSTEEDDHQEADKKDDDNDDDDDDIDIHHENELFEELLKQEEAGIFIDSYHDSSAENQQEDTKSSTLYSFLHHQQGSSRMPINNRNNPSTNPYCLNKRYREKLPRREGGGVACMDEFNTYLECLEANDYETTPCEGLQLAHQRCLQSESGARRPSLAYHVMRMIKNNYKLSIGKGK